MSGRSTAPLPSSQALRLLAKTPKQRTNDDTGAETAEIVLILPVLMALLLLGFQLAMWGLAAHAISLGVAEGGAVARSQLGTQQRARALVDADVSGVAGSLVGSLTIAVRALPDDFVAVSASGVVPTVFPGFHVHVSAVSAGPSQDFRASG